MKPDSSSPSGGGPLPPRHRTKLESLAKDTTEQDLWDFGDDEVDPAPSPRGAELPKEPEPPEEPASATKEEDEEDVFSDLPEPIEEPEAAPPAPTPIPAAPAPSDTKAAASPKGRRSGKSIDAPLQPIDDLDDDVDPGEWDELPEPAPAAAPEAKGDLSDPIPAVEPDIRSETPPEMATTPSVEGESAPKQPGKLPKISLSKAELGGIGAFVALLLVIAVFFLLNSINRLPTKADLLTSRDFPIKGERVTASAAETYWREPVLTGENRDSVRSGTSLIPVLEITTAEADSAIRVYFRNGDNQFIGDPVSLPTRAGSALVIPATAGFEDEGMHAAYRTGDTSPWTVEVLEGPSPTAPGHQFKTLFKINISTARR